RARHGQADQRGSRRRPAGHPRRRWCNEHRRGRCVALPTDFPGDVFLPASYDIDSVMDVGGARLVSLEAEGSVTSMFKAARTDMQRKGWSQTLAMQQADSAMLGFSHGEREATYTFTGRNGQQLMVGIQLRDRSTRH